MPKPPAGEAPNDETEDSLRSRTDARKERLEFEDGLMELAVLLVALTDVVRARMELPEDLLYAVEQARRTKQGSARNRALRLVRSALRAADAREIRKRLDGIHGR